MYPLSKNGKKINIISHQPYDTILQSRNQQHLMSHIFYRCPFSICKVIQQQINNLYLNNLEFEMHEQKFIDSLDITFSEFEVATTKIINKRAPAYQKLEDLGLTLAYLKTNLFKALIKFNKQLTKICDYQYKATLLESQYLSTRKTFQKLNLHNILSRKIQKIIREETLHQISQTQSFHLQYSKQSQLPKYENVEPNIDKLKNSLYLLEQNLGIENSEDKFSNIPIQLNQSVMTSRLIMERLDQHREKTNKNSSIHISKVGEKQTIHDNDEERLLDKSISDVIHRSMASIQCTPIRFDNGKETQESMLNQSVTSNYFGSQLNTNEQTVNHTINDKYLSELTKQHQPEVQSKISPQQSLKQKKQTVKGRKKTKAIVYSTKDRLLDNLLQESYMTCYNQQSSAPNP